MATRPTIDELVALLERIAAAGGRDDPRSAEIWPNADVLIAYRTGRTSVRPDELELHRLVVETFLASHVGTIDDQVHEIVGERMASGRRRQRREKFRKAFANGMTGD